MEHGIAYHLTAIAGHLREAGVHYSRTIIELPEADWTVLASKIEREMGMGLSVTTVGGKGSKSRQFQFNGITYRSLG